MLEKATFGAGCFWQVQAAFSRVYGVIDTTAGYEGGAVENPSYQDVCRGTTGHAEVVEVIFDPEKVSYRQLLEVFFSIHDPTTVDRQGPDRGSQYRSVIFYHTEEQKREAVNSLRRLDLSKRYRGKAVTKICLASQFWKAESYHQHYLEKKKR